MCRESSGPSAGGCQGYTPDLTVEFWIAPDRTEDPGYDAAIIGKQGPEGVSYLVAMLRDRSGIAVATATSRVMPIHDTVRKIFSASRIGRPRGDGVQASVKRPAPPSVSSNSGGNRSEG